MKFVNECRSNTEECCAGDTGRVSLNLYLEPFPLGAVLEWLLLDKRRALAVAEVQRVVHVSVARAGRSTRGGRALVAQPVRRRRRRACQSAQPPQHARVRLVHAAVARRHLHAHQTDVKSSWPISVIAAPHRKLAIGTGPIRPQTVFDHRLV